MKAPNWLTNDYIAESLRLFYKDKYLKLHFSEIEPALGKGENFGGILTRVRVKYETQNKTHKRNLLVKSSFEGDAFATEKMKPYDIFNREMSVYENVMPKLKELLKEINDDEQLFAEAIRVDYERQALIFEDLSERAFVMANRVDCLDLSHAKLILRKIAKMHATSAVLNERIQGSLECYDRGFFNRYTDNYASYFVGTLIACAQYLSKVPGYTHFAKKLFDLAPNYMDIGRNCFRPAVNQINVFAHGDLWTNNVMFRYKEGVPQDVLLIDFQYSFWGPPALDLHHFFNTSLKEDLRLHSQDALFQYYHKYFADTLIKLKYEQQKVPSLREFRLQAEERLFFGLTTTALTAKILIFSSDDLASLDFIQLA